MLGKKVKKLLKKTNAIVFVLLYAERK